MHRSRRTTGLGVLSILRMSQQRHLKAICALRSDHACHARLRAFPPKAVVGPNVYVGLERRGDDWIVTPIHGRPARRARAIHYCEQLAEATPRHQFKILS